MTPDPQQINGYKFPPLATTHTERDAIIYALGVGAGHNPVDPEELKYVYEIHPNFSVLPSMAVTFPFNFLGHLAEVPTLQFNPMMILHGEQELTLHRPIPTAGQLTHHGKIEHIFDKGKGALVWIAVHTVNEAGEAIADNRYGFFIRGLGGFGGDRGNTTTVEIPDRLPDAVVRHQTRPDQALLYRLSGDRNPLHADPAMAAFGGFERPILHGLSTFGFAGRAVLQAFAAHNPARLASLKVRFSKPIFPGETIVTEMWQQSETEIIFQSQVAERNQTILSNAIATLQ